MTNNEFRINGRFDRIDLIDNQEYLVMKAAQAEDAWVFRLDGQIDDDVLTSPTQDVRIEVFGHVDTATKELVATEVGFFSSNLAWVSGTIEDAQNPKTNRKGFEVQYFKIRFDPALPPIKCSAVHLQVSDGDTVNLRGLISMSERGPIFHAYTEL